MQLFAAPFPIVTIREQRSYGNTHNMHATVQSNAATSPPTTLPENTFNNFPNT